MTRVAAAAALALALATLAGCATAPGRDAAQLGRETALATACDGAERKLAAAFARARRGAYTLPELILLGDLDAEKRMLCTQREATGFAAGRVVEIGGAAERIGGAS